MSKDNAYMIYRFPFTHIRAIVHNAQMYMLAQCLLSRARSTKSVQKRGPPCWITVDNVVQSVPVLF